MCTQPKPWQCILVLVSVLVLLAVFIAFTSSRPPRPEPLDCHEPPDSPRPPRHGAPVPAVMMDLFHRGPHEQIAAEIVRSLAPRRIGAAFHRLHEGRVLEHLRRLTFAVPEVPPGEALHSAQLRLTLAFLDWSLRPAQDVESTVSMYWPIGTDSTPAAASLEVRNCDPEQRIVLDCTGVINQFHKQNGLRGGELQLEVGVIIAPGRKVHPLISGDHVDKQPLLLLLYTPSLISGNISVTPDSKLHRKKRDSSAEDYEEETNRIWSGALVKTKQKKNRNLCRRKPLYVEFSDINYDTWIVAPSGYQAYQCVGKCVYPLSDHLTPTKHAIIQTLLHSQQPSKTQRSCCVPTRLDSISILYLDSQGVLTYRLSYKEMVVAECGCR